MSIDSQKKSLIFQIGTMITEVMVVRATTMVFAAVKMTSARYWMEVINGEGYSNDQFSFYLKTETVFYLFCLVYHQV